MTIFITQETRLPYLASIWAVLRDACFGRNLVPFLTAISSNQKAHFVVKFLWFSSLAVLNAQVIDVLGNYSVHVRTGQIEMKWVAF